MAAGLLSLFPTLAMEYVHGTDGKPMIVEKTMQNDASHLSYGEIKHAQVKKTKNRKFETLNCPEPNQISSYRGLRGTIRRRKTRSFFWEGSQGVRKPSKG